MLKLIAYRGTLILTTFCREGLVICADKRALARHQGGVSVLDDQQKIIKPLANIPFFFGATGNFRILDLDYPSTSFDAIETLDSFAKREGVLADPLAYFTKAGEEIKKAFSYHLNTRGLQDWPDEEEDNEHLHVLCFYPDGRRLINIIRLVLYYFKGPPARIAVSEPGLVRFDGLFHGFGDFRTGELLSIEGDNTLEDYRNDALISLFLSPDTTPDMVSCEQAIEFSRKVIEISNSTGPTRERVSKTSDCVVLRGITEGMFRRRK